ncbi:MAG: tRNA (adenosine(37)-N6)-threonylcarbamoyltransferase complex dimerization subunit type 1 TsaB [bacterium]|nr:tRNA (adenosine(37)-N6)-threonylcarbamoyltransferase complex dimerization subunit type 1 TsaB [bacterium]
MKIAALESSGLVASVALMQDETLLAEYTVNYKKTHSQTLLPMLEELKRMTELDLSTLDAVAVSAGPGSFTGLRIGSATAKGLGMALDIPIIAVPTLEALAYNCYGTDQLVCPIMDARRGQVYTGVYRFERTGGKAVPEEAPKRGGADAPSSALKEEDNGEATQRGAVGSVPMRRRLVALEEACALPIEQIAERAEELARRYRTGILFLGDGVPVFRERLAQLLTVPYTFAPPHRCMQSAASVAALAMVKAAEGAMQSAAEHKPFYLRVSQAERERNEAVIIRRMREEDLEQVSRLEEETFSMPWSISAFREMVNHPDAYYFVAVDRDSVCGTCGIRNLAGEGELTNVVVREEYRNSGLGQLLIAEALDKARAAGMQAFTLEVRKSNAAAIHVYEKLGFVSEGIRPGFYEKPAEDAVIMWKRS